MNAVALRLLVLRTQDLERLAHFYRALGVMFAHEQHGAGALHYAGRLGDVVFELYPSHSAGAVDSTTRLGFAVADVDGLVQALRITGTPIVREPQATEWGYQAVVKDPDGRAVELYSASER